LVCPTKFILLDKPKILVSTNYFSIFILIQTKNLQMPEPTELTHYQKNKSYFDEKNKKYYQKHKPYPIKIGELREALQQEAYRQNKSMHFVMKAALVAYVATLESNTTASVKGLPDNY
jgi:hypothetical protein